MDVFLHAENNFGEVQWSFFLLKNTLKAGIAKVII